MKIKKALLTTALVAAAATAFAQNKPLVQFIATGGDQVSHMRRAKLRPSPRTVRSPRGVAMYQWYQ